jgi:hypothetical protein
MVLNGAPTFSGCLLDVRVIGGILLKKNDVRNDRRKPYLPETA